MSLEDDWVHGYYYNKNGSFSTSPCYTPEDTILSTISRSLSFCSFNKNNRLLMISVLGAVDNWLFNNFYLNGIFLKILNVYLPLDVLRS